MYLSGGTCVTLIMIGGGTMKIFYHIVCGNNVNPLTIVEWYLVFTGTAIVIAQLPNLNSIAGVSLIGAITAVTYCTLIWVLSVTRERPIGVSYDHPALPLRVKSDVAASVFSILNALGITVFAFRGHNLVLEIQVKYLNSFEFSPLLMVILLLLIPVYLQGTMPSSIKSPSRLPMWKGVKFAYLIIAMCLYPLAIGSYWAYGNLVRSTI